MTIRNEIESYNLKSLNSYPRIANEIIEEAINEEMGELSADKFLRAILSIGEQDAKGPDATRIISLSYADREEGPVYNFYQFFNSVYRRVITRKGAFYYKQQKELDNLHKRFHQNKQEKFIDLSQSTRSTIESIIEHNSEVIEAKSKRIIEKKSYIQIRRIFQQEEKTSQQLEDLSAGQRLDIKGIYSALEKISLRINSHERSRRHQLQESQTKIIAFFKDFMAALEDPLSTMTALGFSDLPKGDCVEELPLTDQERLNKTVSIILAADLTIHPQNIHSKHSCYPMPKVVLAPVVGFVTCATGLAVEKFRENIIFFPIRCLEDPVSGLVRELTKLKRKINPRAIVMARENYLDYVKANNLIGGGYENMYENFIRFCLGDEKTIDSLSEDELRIIQEHFIPSYTQDIYAPSWMRPVLSRLGIESGNDRTEFNLEIDANKQQPFAAGVLCSDRAKKYRKYLSELKSAFNNCDPEFLEKTHHSLLSNRAAAKRFFNQAYRDGDNPMMSLYNTALLLYHEAEENQGHARRDLLKKSSILFSKSREDAFQDLWSYKAEGFISRCKAIAGDNPASHDTPQNINESIEDKPSNSKESSVFKWIKGKFGNKM